MVVVVLKVMKVVVILTVGNRKCIIHHTSKPKRPAIVLPCCQMLPNLLRTEVMRILDV